MQRNHKKRVVSLLLCAAMLLSVSACGQTADDSQDEATEPLGTITLVDQAGREVVLESPAETIVSCYYITSYACIALGVQDKLIGIESKAETRSIYQLAALELLELTQVGSLKEFNVEAVAALAPELVIMPLKLKDHADTLTELGINVLVVNPESQEELEEMLTLIARATGAEATAEKLLAYYTEKLQMVSDVASNVREVQKQTVYMTSNSSLLETAPKNMYQGNLIETAGGINAGENIDDDYWTEVSYEDLLVMNPDIIVLPSGASFSVDDVLGDAALENVKAVISGMVYQMPTDFEEMDSPVPSGILGTMWMCSILHQGIYTLDEFEADMMEFYREFYGIELVASEAALSES